MSRDGGWSRRSREDMRMTAVKTVSRTFGRKGSRKIEDDGKAKRITPGRPIFGFGDSDSVTYFGGPSPTALLDGIVVRLRLLLGPRGQDPKDKQTGIAGSATRAEAETRAMQLCSSHSMSRNKERGRGGGKTENTKTPHATQIPNAATAVLGANWYLGPF